MKVIECEQRSGVWFAARAGKVTSCGVADVMKKLKSGGESAARRNYRTQLVVETLTGHPLDGYVSRYMKDGAENEPLARAAYEFDTRREVDLVGFVIHPTIERGGASPDGLLGDDGLLEIKCPQMSIHLEYMLAGEVPEEYRPQIQWQLACTEREWCDFVSYGADPNLPEHLRLFTVRVERDDKLIHEMEQCVRGFLLEVDDIIARLPQAPVVIPESVSVAG